MAKWREAYCTRCKEWVDERVCPFCESSNHLQSLDDHGEPDLFEDALEEEPDEDPV